jgi:hypothetical protein
MKSLAHVCQLVLTEDPRQTTLQQPKPRPPKRRFASFLKDFVDSNYLDRPSLNTFISDWLASIGLDREKRSQSDSHLRHSEANLIPRKLTGSAPEMGSIRSNNQFLIPPPNTSVVMPDAGSTVPVGTMGRPSECCPSRKLVEDRDYRSAMAVSGVRMRHSFCGIPEHISNLVSYIQRDRDSPGPSPNEVRQDTRLLNLEMGAGEPQVTTYFNSNIFPVPEPDVDGLERSERVSMSKHTVPNPRPGVRLNAPKPAILYGYHRYLAFPQQETQLFDMRAEAVATANGDGLLYPFLVIEVQGDGPTDVGTLWAATNQCLGGSTSCVKIAELLNDRLRECKSDKIQLINSAVFSIAMTGTEARLYISWKHNELDYYMQKIESFLLQTPDHYLKFRKYVRNIIDWGKNTRMNEIRGSLDSLLKEGIKKTSEAAKSRLVTFDGSMISNKRVKTTKSKGMGGYRGPESGLGSRMDYVDNGSI